MLLRNQLMWSLGIGICLAVLLSPQRARGDGCYIPERAVKKMPAIPLQRAILVYKDRTERLIIESSLNGEGQRFGWIVPVPSKPTKMEAVSPGLFKTLFIQTRPHVTHEPFSPSQIMSFIVIAALTAVAGLVVLVLNPRSREEMWSVWLFPLIALPVCMCLWFPGCGSAASAGPVGREIPGVQVEGISTIGSYEVALLQAESPDSLNRWLDENGFASLPAEGGPIVADYIRSGWHFVAVKLQREGQGLARPHPLALEFPSGRAVYPMRLTAIAGCPVALELLVIANQQASVEGLATELAASLRGRRWTPAGPVRYMPAAGEIGATVAHRDADSMVWDGCWLTRFEGTLEPKDMTSDIELQWQVGTPCRHDLYSYSGARTMAGALAVGLWFVGLPIALFCIHARCAIEGRRRKYLLRGFLPTLAACGVLYLAIYLPLDKVEVDQTPGRRMFRPSWDDPSEIQALLMKARRGKEFATLDDLRKVFASYLADIDLRNCYTHEPVAEEDSPGNYTLREDKTNGTCMMAWYHMDMRERELSIP